MWRSAGYHRLEEADDASWQHGADDHPERPHGQRGQPRHSAGETLRSLPKPHLWWARCSGYYWESIQVRRTVRVIAENEECTLDEV